jgi:hypothetical protein
MIALFGANGSIGRRYQCILNSLGVPFRAIEVKDYPNWKGITKAIIATPTETHYPVSMLCEDAKVPYLLEKPVTKNVHEMNWMTPFRTPGWMVNNYSFLAPNGEFGKYPLESIEYNFYNTGKDGLHWDLCQLVWMSELTNADLKVETDSYTWTLKLNDVRIPYEDIEDSYAQMLLAFIEGDEEKLWPLKDGLALTKLLLEMEKNSKGYIHEGFLRAPSEKQLRPIAKKDLSKNRA